MVGGLQSVEKASQSLRPQAQIKFKTFLPAACTSEKISHRRAGNPCVGQPAFSVLFALFSLAGDSPPASKRTKIPRKSKAVRCEAVLPEQKCSQTRKRPQRILCVFSRALTQYEGISARQNRVCPCQSTLFCRQLICTQVQQTYTSEQHNKQTAANQRNDIRIHHVNSLSVCSTKPAARVFVRRVVF